MTRGKMNKRIYNILNHATVSEKAIEKYLVERVAMMGGLCLKYSNPGMQGYPDRIVMLPGGRTLWVELKSKGRKQTRIQQLRAEALRAVGQEVHVCDSRVAIDRALEGPRP